MEHNTRESRDELGEIECKSNVTVELREESGEIFDSRQLLGNLEFNLPTSLLITILRDYLVFMSYFPILN